MSQGEKRILYLLYVIFEVKKLQKENKKTLIISDDISDSFDYKNKNIILQYLKDISDYKDSSAEGALFYQIILTHNFDFFRSIYWKLEVTDPANLYFVERDEEEIIKFSFIDEEITNPFKNFIDRASAEIGSNIALIPFVRNLSQHINKEDYNSLSSVLHYRNGGKGMKLSALNIILNKYIFRDEQNKLKEDFTPDEDILVFTSIDSLAGNIVTKAERSFCLQNKLLLSIAIRLETEKFLKNLFGDAVNDDWRLEKLYPKCKEAGLLSDDNIEMLDLITIAVPENLHINSFMYEPILDTPISELIYLHNNIKRVNGGASL